MTEAEQDKFYEVLGEKIREARKRMNISQEAFADYLYLSRTSVVNMEKGRHRPPIHTLFFISEILKTDLYTLLPNDSIDKNNILPVSTEWKKKVKEASMGNKQLASIVLGFVGKATSSNT